MLSIGIPREIKPRENRVGCTPDGTQRLTAAGLTVWVEKGAGAGSGFDDDAYRQAGAGIADSHEMLFEKAELIYKVKEPQRAEFHLLRKEHLLFCFLHLASPHHCELTHVLKDTRVTAVGFETISTEKGQPVLKPMSEIAGALSACFGAFFLSAGYRDVVGIDRDDLVMQLEHIGRHYPEYPKGISPGQVIVFGGGVAGVKAAEYSRSMGGTVTVVESDTSRVQALRWDLCRTGGMTVEQAAHVPDKVFEQADILVGAAHRAGNRAQKVMDIAELRRLSAGKKKIIMDIAIDQGGNFPEARPTTYDHPLYRDSADNLRFSVANIPSLCGKGATTALTEATVAYAEALALDRDRAFKQYPELRTGLNLDAGKILNHAVLEAHQL